MDTKGVEFDPRMHEPVMQVESEEHPDNTIVQELRAGYFLGDKVMRAALVSVASNASIPAPSVLAAKEEAEKQKLEAENHKLEAERLKREAEDQKIEAENQRRQAEQEKLEAEQQRLEAEQEKLLAMKAKLEADKARLEAEKQKSSDGAPVTAQAKETTAPTTAAPLTPPPKKTKAEIEADTRGVYDLGDLDDV